MELEELGIKSQKQKQFESKGIMTVEDLLQFLPRTYKDLRSITGVLPKDQLSLLR